MIESPRTLTTLIVGCGYLGRRVAARLVAAGLPVIGTTRSVANAEALRTLGVTPLVVDVTEPASLRNLPEVDRVLHCVGFDRKAGVPLREVQLVGLGHVLAALEGRSVRLVHTSSTSVYGQNDGSWVDENSPTVPATESGRVCLEAEGLVLARGGVVVRYSGLYGPGRMIRRESLERGDPIPADPSKYLNLIQVEDAATAAILALDRGESGQVYLATDDRPVRREEYYGLAARLLGAPTPRFEPPEPGSPGARDESHKRASNRRIKAELGLVLAYPDVTTGLPAALS
ncbi:MAG: SDR family oxidoreductase [Isosphaeraceae bacterium]